MTTHIRLQSSCGDFSDAFVKRLPALEKAMIEQGLDPSDFVIAKDPSHRPLLPYVFRMTGNPVDYTVFVKGESFTVTYPDDLSFLKYFYQRCVSNTESEDDLDSVADKQPTAKNQLAALMGRLIAWFNKPI